MFTVMLRHRNGRLRRQVSPFYGDGLFRYIDAETRKGHTVLYIGAVPEMGRIMPQSDKPGESFLPMAPGESFSHWGSR